MTNQRKEELKKKFNEKHSEYVNATILHMEVVGTRDSINFDEESEWVADYWLSQFDNIINEKIEKVEDYFKGLIAIPNPQATKKNLITILKE